MDSDLADAQCKPCRGGVPPLSRLEVSGLLASVPGWASRDDVRIERRFAFKTFAAACDFVRDVAALAETEDHHPDICFGWGYATISLQTKAIRGLHLNDFILAAKIDRLLRAPNSSEGGQ